MLVSLEFGIYLGDEQDMGRDVFVLMRLVGELSV